MSNTEQLQVPAHWRIAQLNDVCEKITDGTHKTPNYQEAGVRFISIKNIRPYQPVNWDSYVKFITRTEHEELIRRCKPEFDDILFPRIGTLGFAKRIDFKEEVSIFVGLGLLKPKKDVVHPKYLEYWMNSPLINKLSHEKATGSGRLTLALEESRRLPIPIAPMHEQLQIVAEIEKQFSRLDEAVTNLKRVKANLKRYKVAVLKAAVEGRLVETEAERARREGRSYETGAQLLQRILETRRSQWEGKGKYKEPVAPDITDLPELPEGWVWTSLESLIVDGPQNGIYLPKSLYGTGHPILRIDDYQQDWMRPVTELQRVRAKPEEVATYSLRSGDIVINRVNSPSHLGKVAVWAIETEMPLFESNMMRAALSSGVVSLYVASYLRSLHGRARLTKQAKWAVNQASINQQDVCGTPVPLPPLAEQNRIVTEVDLRLSVLRETEAQVDANLQRAERLRQAILGKAFKVPQSQFAMETIA
jgi:type I restriction enzyme S subunit